VSGFDQKILAKNEFGKFTFIQPLLIERTLQSLKFDKPFLLPLKELLFSISVVSH
jgi:hypothetical protein